MAKLKVEYEASEILGSNSYDAPVLMICDAPSQLSYDRKQFIGPNEVQLLKTECKRYGLSQSDFSYLTPCGPIPKDVKTSEARGKAFLDAHKEAFEESLSKYSPKLILYMGKYAGRQYLGRAVKITKARGQIGYKEKGGIPSMGSLSPMNVLVRPETKEDFSSDFSLLGQIKQNDWEVASLLDDVDASQYMWAKPAELQKWIDNPPKALFVDTEFKNLRWYADSHYPICVQISDGAGVAKCFPTSYMYIKAHSELYPEIRYSGRQVAKCLEILKTLMEDERIAKAGFNFKIDMHVMENLGIKTKNWFADAQMLAFAVDENMMRISQSECVRRWVRSMAGYSDEFDKTVDKSAIETATPDEMLNYGGGDVDAGYRLTQTLIKLVKKDAQQWNVMNRVQMPALRCFQQMERHGLKIDVDALANLQTMLAITEEQEYNELIRDVPVTIRRKHLAQPNQKGKDPKDILSFTRDDFVRDILFSEEGLGVKPTVFTASTRDLPKGERIPSASIKEHLPLFAEDYPFVIKLINYKKLAKMRSTYVGMPEDPKKGGAPSGFWQYLNESTDNYIHPSFHLHRTVTGRTASSDPNSQNYPKRGYWAKEFRKIFKAKEGHKLIEVDLSQAEIRVAAWMAGETTMIKIYNAGGDIHAATAARMIDMSMGAFAAGRKSLTLLHTCAQDWVGAVDYLHSFSEDKAVEVTVAEFCNFKRYQAKAVNFGFLYGMGWRKFKSYAKTDYGVDLNESQAQDMRDTFFETYPKLVKWHYKMREQVGRQGYVRALHGAIRHLPNITSKDDMVVGESERQAVNSPVQRFASDIGLMGMARFARDVDWSVAQPLAFIHDAVIVQAPDHLALEIAGNIKWYMESNPYKQWFGITPALPILADASIGSSLADMEEMDEIQAIKPDWYRGDENKSF
jgi:uracil-DNA glycosylase family 4